MVDLIKKEKNRVILGILDNLKSEFNITGSELIELLMSSERGMLPVEVFADRKLSAMQGVVKYMKENLEYRNKQIADVLGKDPRSVWDAYEKGKSRKKGKFVVEKSEMPIPIGIFKGRVSLLESVVVYLRNQGWTNRKIAKVLNRSETTISTMYSRGKKK